MEGEYSNVIGVPQALDGAKSYIIDSVAGHIDIVATGGGATPGTIDILSQSNMNITSNVGQLDFDGMRGRARDRCSHPNATTLLIQTQRTKTNSKTHQTQPKRNKNKSALSSFFMSNSTTRYSPNAANGWASVVYLGASPKFFHT